MSAYRDDLAALAARQDALAAEVADKTRQLEVATQLLEEVRAKARLPVLDNLRVASPCTVDWEQMSGDDRVRACAQCQKKVYNLSELTREEAEALIVRTHGDLCGRYYQRKDGTVLLKDCEVGVARNRKRKAIAVGAAAFLGGFGALLALAHRHQATPVAAPCALGEVAAASDGPSDGPSEVPIDVDLADPVEPPPVLEIEMPSVTMGLIMAPSEDEALVLERQIAELKLERATIDQRLHEVELAKERLQRDRPSRPIEIRIPTPGEGQD